MAFAVSLVWYTPVRFVAHHSGLPNTGPVAISRLSGTLWHGRLQIDGAHHLTWTIRIGGSLWAFGLAADWQIAGPDADISGAAVLRPSGIDLGPLSGRTGWPLVSAVLPNLLIACTGEARLAGVTLQVGPRVRDASGTVTTPDAECRRLDGQGRAVPAPALHAQLASTDDGTLTLLVTPQAGARVALLSARLTPDDRVVVTIHKEGAALVPGMPSTADSELELPLALLLGQ